jgi:hypothetical protein
MTARIVLLKAEYSSGMVRCSFNQPPAAVVNQQFANVAAIAAAVEKLRADWTGHIDGQILIGLPIGRKVAGFDSYKASYSRDVRALATSERAA